MLIIKTFELFKKFNPNKTEKDFEDYLKILEEFNKTPIQCEKIDSKEFQKYIKSNPDKDQMKLLDDFIDERRQINQSI